VRSRWARTAAPDRRGRLLRLLMGPAEGSGDVATGSGSVDEGGSTGGRDAAGAGGGTDDGAGDGWSPSAKEFDGPCARGPVLNQSDICTQGGGADA
jgi:hypothetical protein